jgi:uncharacterized protein DUF6348
MNLPLHRPCHQPDARDGMMGAMEDMQELIDWAIAAYMSNPDASDADVAELLAGGFPRGLATRAVAFLPLAFGRRLLEGLTTVADTFVLDGRELPLAAEPVFLQARTRAAQASREQVQRIGLRSAEVNAVNKALQAGAKPGDLVLAPPLLLTIDGPTTGGVTAATMLAEFLAAHSSALACEARVHPWAVTAKSTGGQLDVLVSAPALGARQIVESFACHGGTITEGRSLAMKRFAQGSLHVLMAALEDPRHGDDQVEWQAWGNFRVCLGALLREWSDDVPVDFGPFLDEIKRRLLAAGLSREVHWYRTFVAVGKDGLFGHDALLDNDPWPPGSDAVTARRWPRAEKPYALRHFFILVPNAA